jgi:hypothetical protein
MAFGKLLGIRIDNRGLWGLQVFPINRSENWSRRGPIFKANCVAVDQQEGLVNSISRGGGGRRSILNDLAMNCAFWLMCELGEVCGL